MDAQKLIEPAATWQGDRWLDRVDACASFLYMHGYIPQSQRAKITQKLEAQLKTALEAGRIVVASITTPKDQTNEG